MTIPLASELYCLPPPVSIHHACLTLHVFAPVLNQFLPFVVEMINPDCLIIGVWRIHSHDLYVPIFGYHCIFVCIQKSCMYCSMGRVASPGAAARHLQPARVQGRAATERSSAHWPRAHWIGPV